jgi:peptidoglycan/xylan/chitin deacetylase (PgdA/CDA1 family)
MHTLMYHDIYPDGVSPDSSGFPGPDAAIYKLSVSSFHRHLEAFERACPSPPTLVRSPADLDTCRDTRPWALTFDDGGSSAYDQVAPALEARGWRGHFFITTARIGAPGFLSADQIRDLHDRGHSIGTHSHNHPTPISALPREQMESEWRLSVSCLAGLTGSPILVGSVPGGYFSRAVGEAAAAAGIRWLFTSEPVSRPALMNNQRCTTLGRYAIKHRTPPESAAALAHGAFRHRVRQQLIWSATGIAKRLGGSYYIRLRRSLLQRSR